MPAGDVFIHDVVIADIEAPCGHRLDMVIPHGPPPEVEAGAACPSCMGAFVLDVAAVFDAAVDVSARKHPA